MTTTNQFKLTTASKWVSSAFGFTDASFEDDFISSNSEQAFKNSTKINLIIETLSDLTDVDVNTICDAIANQIMDTSNNIHQGHAIDFSDDTTIEAILSNANIPADENNPTTVEIVAISNSKAVVKNIVEIIDASGVDDFEADAEDEYGEEVGYSWERIG